MLLRDLRFIVVDDMLTTRKILIHGLNEIGAIAIVGAASGKLAWDHMEKAAESGKPFHMIVSDWHMPDMTGDELLRKCRANEHYKSCGFIFVTSATDVASVTQAMAEGADNYVVKPFTTEVFAEKVKAVAKKRFP